MISINEPYLNKEDFCKKIRHAIDDILYRAMDAEGLGSVIYDDIFVYVIYQINSNIRAIISDIENGQLSWRMNTIETNARMENESLKNKIYSLESQIVDLQTQIHNLSK